MTYTIPADNHVVTDTGHTTDHNDIVDVLTGMGAVSNVLNTAYSGGADPTGGSDSTSAIQDALLSFGTLGGAAQGVGGRVYVPPGQYLISKTLVIPAGVRLVGSSWGSQLTLVTNSGCDMIQPATYQSASQASILGVSASAIANAFWAGISKMWLHGDAFHATAAAYCHGINVTTNPLTTTAGSDPDFDPMFRVSDTRIEATTGDGYFHSGRSGAELSRVWVAYCNGVGITPSFDTTLKGVLVEGCGSGLYLNHSSNLGSGVKSYNNNDLTWVSGTSYAPASGAQASVCVYNGAMYFCIAAVSGSTPPPSDGAHWTVLGNATAPQATGCDWFFDTGAGAHCWTGVESQQPSKSGYYFKGPNAGAVTVVGQSENVNFNNGQPGYNSANPNSYAAVVLDGVSGVHVTLNSSTQGGGGSGDGIICTSANSPGVNTLIAGTDGTETALFSGGIPTLALVNGKFQSAVTSGVVTLTFAGTLNVNAALGNHFRVTLAGNATVAAPTGLTDGQKITIEVIQDSTGSRTLTWNAAFDFGTAGAPTLTTTPGKRDLIGFAYSASAAKWLFAGSQAGF